MLGHVVSADSEAKPQDQWLPNTNTYLLACPLIVVDVTACHVVGLSLILT